MAEEILAVILNKIKKEEFSERKSSYIVAVDGRCASGKTTLAEELAECLSCSVIHMDHFFFTAGTADQRADGRAGRQCGPGTV